jgi:hypothetical protein
LLARGIFPEGFERCNPGDTGDEKIGYGLVAGKRMGVLREDRAGLLCEGSAGENGDTVRCIGVDDCISRGKSPSRVCQTQFLDPQRRETDARQRPEREAASLETGTRTAGFRTPAKAQ